MLLLFAKGLALGLAIAAPVGPIGLLCIRRTLTGGPALGFATGLGAATADAAYGAVAGFGRIRWLAADRLAPPVDPASVAAAEPGIVAHMNDDHGDAIQLYARAAGSREVGWRMTGADIEGCDLRLGAAVLRIDFARPCADAGAIRAELVRMVRAARVAFAHSAA